LRALFAFAFQLTKQGAYDDAVEFLNGAVTTLNALSGGRDETGGQSQTEVAKDLSDPNIILAQGDMEQAFVAIGLFDLDTGLTQSKKIQPKPVQLMARLQTIQGVIKRDASKPRMPAPRVSTGNSPKP
jgi:hypothetical protein